MYVWQSPPFVLFMPHIFQDETKNIFAINLKPICGVKKKNELERNTKIKRYRVKSNASFLIFH